MFFDDKKKYATTILSKRNEKGDRTMNPTVVVPEINKDDTGAPSVKHMAAEDILAAHQEGSPHKLQEALSNFIDLHRAGVDQYKGGESVDKP